MSTQAWPAAAAPPRVVGGRKSPMQLAFDGDRQEMTVRMRYTTALVSGFAVLVVVGLAYILGRHMSEGPQPARAAGDKPSSAQVKKGPAQPNVMDLSQRQGRGSAGRVPDGTAANGPVAPNGRTGGGVDATGSYTAYVDARLVNGAAQRVNNLNYMLIQSYPPREMRQAAYELRDFLTANGIPCTVEQASKEPGAPKLGVNDGWYCVVGTRGFPPRYGQLREYQVYVNAINAAFAKYPKKKKLAEPRPFKWAE